MAGRRKRVIRENRRTGIIHPIRDGRESGISEVIGTILILGLVVIVMSAVIFMVELNLPHTTPPSANVTGLDINYYSLTASTGYLGGNFVYASGPALSIENFYFLMIVGNHNYEYSFTNFTQINNFTGGSITAGTTVLFDSAAMNDTNGLSANAVPLGANYSFDILYKGNIIWTWSSSATTYTAQPQIAYSWWNFETKNSINLYAAVYGSVNKVQGDFSKVYPGNQSLSAPVDLTQSSFGVYNITLPIPYKAGYYEIIVTTNGPYSISGWYYLNYTPPSIILGRSYAVTFFEEPLIPGAYWSISITGDTGQMNYGPINSTSAYHVNLPTGNYTLNANITVSGYKTYTHVFFVNNSNTTVPVFFNKSGKASPAAAVELSGNSWYSSVFSTPQRERVNICGPYEHLRAG